MKSHKQHLEIQSRRTLEQTQESVPSSLPHRDNKKLSRGKQIASTILLIFSGILLYADNFLDFGLDLNQPVPNFIILKNFIYALEISIAPIIIIFASRMKPFTLAYLVPLYAYMNMIIGNIILIYGYEIFDFWWYRLLIAGTVIPVYFILRRTIQYYEIKTLQDEIKDELLEMYKKQDFDEK
ncbi:hypothetical protein [Chryseobacterium terrae]|uniref:Uncharacterized protein n=1 Tax=Chryseobacterium terrae TaxID=3163299 RepID=A0ABW8Y6N7_9FLAO